MTAKPAHAQGTVTGVTVTPSVSTVTVPVNTPATFTATATAGTPNPDQYWTVIAGPTYSWGGYGSHDLPTKTFSQTYSSAGTYTVTPSCNVSYIVQYARGGTATISETVSAAKPVTIYVIGGPITGTSDEYFFCLNNDYSSYGYLTAASGQPTGTSYSWSISGSAIYINDQGQPYTPTTASAIYNGTSPGSTNKGDVTATVTYKLNNVSVTSPNFPITVHVPATFTIIPPTTPATPLKPPSPNAYGFTGQSITFQVVDSTGIPFPSSHPAYWDETWSQPVGGGQPSGAGEALDGTGKAVDTFSGQNQSQPVNPNGDQLLGPLTHVYSITNHGGTGGSVGCSIQTYTNVYYYTYGITGNGF